MELYIFLQQLSLTAFVALIFSVLIIKFYSVVVSKPSDGDHVKLGQKGVEERVKLNKVLKVSGSKSRRKRVRFAADIDGGVERVEFSGVDGSVGEIMGGFREVSEGGVFAGDDAGQVFDEVTEREVGGCDIVREGSGVAVEELGVEGRSEMEGEIVYYGVGELDCSDQEVSGLEESINLYSGDVIGVGSRLVEMVEERREGDANVRNSEDQDLSDVGVEEDSSVDVTSVVGLAGGDILDRGGEFEVMKELVVEKNSEDNLNGRDVMNVAFDEKACIEEDDNEKRVGLGGDDFLGDPTGEIKLLNDLVTSESVVGEETIQGNKANSVIISETIENQMVGDEISMTLTDGNIDLSEEVRVVEVNQETEVEEEMDKGNIGEGLVIDEDDDWEGIERSDLEMVFAAAVNYVDNGGKEDKLLNLGNDEQMQLYALQKVAMEGPCYEGQPMALKISARAKWNAWQRLGNMNPEAAMGQYVNMLSDKDPGWMEGQTSFTNPETAEPIDKQIHCDILLALLPKSRQILAAKCVGVCLRCLYYFIFHCLSVLLLYDPDVANYMITNSSDV